MKGRATSSTSRLRAGVFRSSRPIREPSTQHPACHWPETCIRTLRAVDTSRRQHEFGGWRWPRTPVMAIGAVRFAIGTNSTTSAPSAMTSSTATGTMSRRSRRRVLTRVLRSGSRKSRLAAERLPQAGLQTLEAVGARHIPSLNHFAPSTGTRRLDALQHYRRQARSRRVERSRPVPVTLAERLDCSSPTPKTPSMWIDPYADGSENGPRRRATRRVRRLRGQDLLVVSGSE